MVDNLKSGGITIEAPPLARCVLSSASYLKAPNSDSIACTCSLTPCNFIVGNHHQSRISYLVVSQLAVLMQFRKANSSNYLFSLHASRSEGSPHDLQRPLLVLPRLAWGCEEMHQLPTILLGSWQSSSLYCSATFSALLHLHFQSFWLNSRKGEGCMAHS